VRATRATTLGLLLSLLVAADAAAQTTTPAPTPAPTPGTTTTAPTPPGAPSPTTPGTTAPEPVSPWAIPSVEAPGVLFPPRVGLDLLYAPAATGPLILTPSLTITEEFNDNVFLDNRNKQSDFITQFTPGLSLIIRQPGLEFTAAYNFTAEIYANQTELNNAANRQGLSASLIYRVSPSVTLTLTDALANNKNTNAASISGISSGRQEVWSNVLAGAVDVALTPRLSWQVSPSYRFERYTDEGGVDGKDSDVYAITTALSYALTPRLGVNGAYDFSYLEIEDEPTSYVHTFRVGGSYQISRTLSAGASFGPSILLSDGDTSIGPSGNARLTQVTSWGSLGVFYDHAFSTSAGFGGPSENQTFGGNVSVTSLVRGLSIDFSPRYVISKSEDVARTQTDINALTLSLGVTYQIARYIAVVGSYTFLHQTSGATGGTDVDQNRVTLGLRFGYPISFD
jgi:hypothetical protein